MYIKAPEPISATYFVNHSHQPVCLYMYSPIIARQRLLRYVPWATNTSNNRVQSQSQSESYVKTDGQSASVSWNIAPIWGLQPEVGSVFCICCWFLPAQSFSGRSPLGLETIFYCLTFETSHFVATYDSQGHGGGIRPRLHTGKQ
jgi:hypothetical protein